MSMTPGRPYDPEGHGSVLHAEEVDHAVRRRDREVERLRRELAAALEECERLRGEARVWQTRAEMWQGKSAYWYAVALELTGGDDGEAADE